MNLVAVLVGDDDGGGFYTDDGASGDSNYVNGAEIIVGSGKRDCSGFGSRNYRGAGGSDSNDDDSNNVTKNKN